MTTTEIYRDVIGYEGLYKVSDSGKVITVKTGKIRKSRVTTYGYLLVDLSKEGVLKTYRVHRLVAMAFISNPENKEQINHIDGVKTNNSISNLEWSTGEENMRHSREVLGNKRDKPVIQLSIQGNKITRFVSITEASIYTGVTIGNISKVCTLKQKTAGGFLWQYA